MNLKRLRNFLKYTQPVNDSAKIWNSITQSSGLILTLRLDNCQSTSFQFAVHNAVFLCHIKPYGHCSYQKKLGLFSEHMKHFRYSLNNKWAQGWVPGSHTEKKPRRLWGHLCNYAHVISFIPHNALDYNWGNQASCPRACPNPTVQACVCLCMWMALGERSLKQGNNVVWNTNDVDASFLCLFKRLKWTNQNYFQRIMYFIPSHFKLISKEEDQLPMQSVWMVKITELENKWAVQLSQSFHKHLGLCLGDFNCCF